MPEETRRDWETIQVNEKDQTERLKIHGGWLYRVVSFPTNSVALVFVPSKD